MHLRVTPTNRRHRLVLTAALAVLLTVQVGALAAADFTDVPDTHSHAAGIAYVADAGITAGCSATEYCPAAGVTRGQMATFLHRASGNAPGIAPSVNAATLGGSPADTFLTHDDELDADRLGGRTPGQVLQSTHYWAYVISNGGLHATSGGITVEKPDTGLYCVIIPKEPGHKAAQVTDATPGASTVTFTVATGHGSPCNPYSTSTTDVVPVRASNGLTLVDANFTISIPRTVWNPTP